MSVLLRYSHLVPLDGEDLVLTVIGVLVLKLGNIVQGLEGELRSQLADARQETSLANRALTASNELAGRLQAHTEVAREQGAAAMQRLTHEHTRTTADLEQRLQQATAALQRSTAAVAVATAEQQERTHALQQQLEVAVAQSSASASRSEELADTIGQIEAQLDAAQTNMAAQAAASQGVESQLQAQVASLQRQLTHANEAAAAAAVAEGGRVSTVTHQWDTASQSTAEEHGKVVHELEGRLQAAQAGLQQATAEAAAKEEDSREVVQALRQQVADAAEQTLVAQGQVFNSAAVIAELRAQVGAAQQAAEQQADAGSNAVDQLQCQVGSEGPCASI